MYHDTSPSSLSFFLYLYSVFLYIFLFSTVSISLYIRPSLSFFFLSLYSLSLFRFCEVSRKVLALIKCRTDLGMTDVWGVASLQSNCLDWMLDKSGIKDETQGFVGFFVVVEIGEWWLTGRFEKGTFFRRRQVGWDFHGTSGWIVCRLIWHSNFFFFLLLLCLMTDFFFFLFFEILRQNKWMI